LLKYFGIANDNLKVKVMKKIERDLLLEKIGEWQIKAQNENDPFNKYLSIFIAYNIFYNLYKKSEQPKANLSRDDSKRAVATLSLMNKSLLFESLKADLEQYLKFIFIYSEEFWGKVGISYTLKGAFQRNDAEESIEMLLKWLYRVRCNLVHGEKNYDDEKQKKLLSMSSLLTEKILQHLIEMYQQLYVNGAKNNLFDD